MNEALKYYYRKIIKIKRRFIRFPKSNSTFDSVPIKIMKEFNKVRYHGPKKLACYNPFVNLYFNSRGNAVACCRNQTAILGKYPENTPEEIWFGKTAQQLREKMSHNDLSMGCDFCEHQFLTKRFSGLPSMHSDRYATTKSVYPKILELELSNKCNLQCVMCSGIVSSSIRRHRECMEELQIVYDSKFVDNLEVFLAHAKEICFYGGEPFLIDLYYDIWRRLLKIKSKAKLHVVTNGTIWNEEIENLLKNLKFTISVSFDAMNKEVFESIRKGAKFETVKENILKFNKILKGKGLSLSITPIKSNWQELPGVIDFCNSLNATINVSYVENPYEMALWTFDSAKLAEIEDYYSQYKFKYSNNYNSTYNLEVFKQCINQISLYKTRNKRIELEYSSSLPEINQSEKIINKWSNEALIRNLIFPEELDKLNKLVKKVSESCDEQNKKSFYKKYAEFVTTEGFISLKNIRNKDLDFSRAEAKLLILAEPDSIYGTSYLDMI